MEGEWLGYSGSKYQTCLIFILTTTDPNILKPTVQDLDSYLSTPGQGEKLQGHPHKVLLTLNRSLNSLSQEVFATTFVKPRGLIAFFLKWVVVGVMVHFLVVWQVLVVG